MKKYIEQHCYSLYDEMHAKIEACRFSQHDSLTSIECCFQSAEIARMQLERFIAGYRFSNLNEEIWFFKTMKPQFSALVEFFILVYKGNMFCPDVCEKKIQEYWQHEIERIKSFFKKHESFYLDYNLGKSDQDCTRFVRCPQEEIIWHPPYDSLAGAFSSHDSLIAACLAREKYMCYIATQNCF